MSENKKLCKDCIHCGLCLNIDRLTLFDKNQPAHCKAFKDNSLFVELPCPIGTKINKLSFIGVDYEKTKEKHKKYYILRCDCGNIKSIRKDLWESGNTKACGCLYETHGQAKGEHSRIYEIYYGMKKRCFNVKNKAYKNYGGRGITICNEWLGANGFVNFYDWAICNGYQDDLTIDRIDFNGNYEPSNCRWITMKEQRRNTRKNVFVEINGVKKVLIDWCSDYKIKYTTVLSRIYSGWEIVKAITTPSRKCKEKQI